MKNHNGINRKYTDIGNRNWMSSSSFKTRYWISMSDTDIFITCNIRIFGYLDNLILPMCLPNTICLPYPDVDGLWLWPEIISWISGYWCVVLTVDHAKGFTKVQEGLSESSSPLMPRIHPLSLYTAFLFIALRGWGGYFWELLLIAVPL